MSAEEIVVEEAASSGLSPGTVQPKERREEKESEQVSALRKFLEELLPLSGRIRIAHVIANIRKLLNWQVNPKERDKCLLMLCRQALWIDITYSFKHYSFFEVAVANLQYGSEELQATEECLYFRKLIEVKKKLDGDQRQLGNGCDLYTTMSIFDDVVQKANFAPEDREKAYRWANAQMDKDESMDALCTELSSKGEMGKVATYRLGRTAAWASIGLGVAMIVAAGISLGGTLGVSFLPIFVPTLWLSYTLISAGVAAIAGATLAKNVTARPYKEACEFKEEQWEGGCIGVKSAFFGLPPREEPSGGIGAVCLGGIGAIIGNSGIFR